jgi:hypothetical protein
MLLPAGFSGAVRSDTNRDHRPDLWLLYRGRALVGAAADSGSDGTPDAAIKEDPAGLNVYVDYDRNGVYDFNSSVHGMNTEDFRRLTPDAVLYPFAPRPPHMDLLQYSCDTRLTGKYDLEVISRPGWCRVRYDADKDTKYDVTAVYEKGIVTRLELDTDKNGSADVWCVFDKGAPSIIKWLAGAKIYYWIADGDKFAIDKDANGSIDALLPEGSLDPKDTQALDLYKSFDLLRRRLAER